MEEYTDTGFDYSGHLRLFGIIAAVMAGIALLCIILTKSGIPAFIFDYDYAGGVKLQIDLGREITTELADEARDICTAAAGQKASVTASSSVPTAIIVKTGSIKSEVRQTIVKKLGEKYGVDKVQLLATSISDTGSGFGTNGKLLTVFFFTFVIIFLFLLARYGFAGACAGAVSTLQCLLVTLLSYVFFRIEVGSTAISSILVSIALSAVSLAVVFDSIRTLWKDGGRDDFTATVNAGIAASIKLVSIILLAALAVILILMFSGSSALREICISLLFADLAAWYTSVLLGGPLWALFGGMKAPKKK
ncbi:MAG: hypothetical protein ACOX66_02565 [Oscillospiraceae bacterium]|jgi:preprotein translocase subunit SecF